MTREERNKRHREYERGFDFYARRRHYEMTRRVKGKKAGDQRSCPWLGMECLSYNQFQKWHSENLDVYTTLHQNWAAAGYPRRLAPSVDRIDESVGYVPSNMRWITHLENSTRALEKGRETNAKKRAG